MAILSKQELLDKLKEFIGDNTDDNAISMLEDVSDSISNLEDISNEDWKTKYEENDKMWRNKYTERFSQPVEQDIVEDIIEEENKQLKFEDLFK